MVPFTRTYHCILARVTKIYLDSNIQKVGNTRKQLFNEWRSISFDENTEIIDAYVTHIRQVAAPPLGLWGTTNFRGVEKHTPHKIILDTVSYRRH